MQKNKTYHTKNREYILEYLKNHKGECFSANEIYKYFLTKGNPISMATIYRQIDKMITTKELRKSKTIDNDTAFYIYIGEENKKTIKAIMQCTTCGKTIPLLCHSADNFAYHLAKEHHFYIELSNTILYGCCESCSK